MPTKKHNAFRKRLDFSKIPATIQIPNLIEVQKRSYDRFLQMDRLPSERDDAGRFLLQRFIGDGAALLVCRQVAALGVDQFLCLADHAGKGGCGLEKHTQIDLRDIPAIDEQCTNQQQIHPVSRRTKERSGRRSVDLYFI